VPRQGPLRRRASFRSRGAEFAIIKPGQAAVFAPGRLTKLGDITIPLTQNEAWQRDAYGFAEVIGELGYLIELTSDSIAACTMRPQQRDPANELGWVDTDDAKANGAWDAFVGPQGGRNELIKRAAEHLYTAGESYLVGTPIKNQLTNQDEGIVWEFLSTEELKPSGNKIQRIGEAGSGGRVDLPEDIYVARLWQPDPRFYHRAYSAVKRNLPICREVVLLTQVVDAIAKGRLNAGIYYLPDEFSFGPFDETENDGADTDDIDEFSEEWIEQITAPVEDRASAASLVPLLMRGPAMIDGKPAKDLMGLVDLARGLDTLYQSLRQEALGRLNSGMDAPPEIVGGKGGLNHWTGYNIDADFIDKHITPKGQKIAEFLTAAYLRPMLIEFEGMSQEEAQNYRLHFDATVLTSRTDTGPAARAAYDRIAIKESSYLRANGFDVSDIPDEEERKRRTLERLMFSEPILWGTRVLGELYPDLADIFTPEDLTSPADEARSRGQGPRQGDGGTSEGVPDSDTGQGPPEARGPITPGGSAAIDGGADESALIERLQTAADAALKRAIERASNRVISRMNGIELPAKEEARKSGKYELLSVLSASDYELLGLQKEDLMRDAWANLETDATGWIRQHFISIGENAFVAEERAKASVQYLSTVLTAHMATAFTKPIPTGMNGLRVPTGFIVRSLEKAHQVDSDPYQDHG